MAADSARPMRVERHRFRRALATLIGVVEVQTPPPTWPGGIRDDSGLSYGSPTGTTFTADTPSDGVTWTTVLGSAMTLANLTGPLSCGLAVTSHSNGKAGSVVFDTVVGSP